MRNLIIVFMALLLTGCAATITITTPNETKVEYNSARKAAIAVSADGAVTILTGAVITDDPAAIVTAITSTVAPTKSGN